MGALSLVVKPASILGVTEDQSGPHQKRFAYWSGYGPGKPSPDGTLAPLSSHELRLEAMRFRRGANSARQRSDFANAE
jgi:hypothetical protein